MLILYSVLNRLKNWDILGMGFGHCEDKISVTTGAANFYANRSESASGEAKEVTTYKRKL